MRPLSIDLDELAFALNSDNTEHYLDLQTGQVLMFAEEGIDPELDELLQDEPDRLQRGLCADGAVPWGREPTRGIPGPGAGTGRT